MPKFIIPLIHQEWTHMNIHIKLQNCQGRPYLSYGFGEALQSGDYLFIAFSKGKILKRKSEGNKYKPWDNTKQHVLMSKK